MTAYKVGEWTVQPNLNRMFTEEKEVKLEPKVLALLNCFARHPGEVLNRDSLVELAWEGVIVSDNTINYTIGMLRKALGDKAKDPKYIQTVAKKGYRLIADVQDSDATTPKNPAVNPEPTERINAEQADESWIQVPKAALVTVTLLVVAALIYAFIPQDEESLTFTRIAPLTTMPGDEFSISVDPTGEWVYYAHIVKGEPFSDIYKQRIEGGQPELVMPATPNQHETTPAISPDESRLAFTRFQNDGCVMFLYTFGAENPEEELGKCGPFFPMVAWLNNEEFLFVSASEKSDIGHIKKMNLANGEVTQLTKNTDKFSNISLALSHDKSRVSIARTQAWKNTQLVLLDLNTMEETILKEFPSWIFGMAWLDNDRYIAYSPGIEKTRVEAFDLQTETVSTIYRQSKPIYTATGVGGSRRLLAQEKNYDTNIHKRPISDDVEALKNDTSPAIAVSTREDWQPKTSRDGTKLAYLSSRTGSVEFWISDSNGENARQLTHLNGAHGIHSYEWNDAGTMVTYDTTDARVFVLDVNTGQTTAISDEETSAQNPVFTPDGTQVVFGIGKDKDWELWRAPISGGEAIQITRNGGYSARFTKDGNLITTKRNRLGFWHLDLSTLEETLLLPDVDMDYRRQWQLRDSGIYFVRDYEGKEQLFLHNLKTLETRRIYENSHYGYTFDISWDEKTIYFTRDASMGGDIVLLQE